MAVDVLQGEVWRALRSNSNRKQRQRARAAVQARDLERINAAAQRLNAEALDALEYQASGEAE